MPNHIGFLDGVFDHKGDCRAPDYGPCSCGMTELLRKARAFDWLEQSTWWDACRSANPAEPEKTFHIETTNGGSVSGATLLEAIETALERKSK